MGSSSQFHMGLFVLGSCKDRLGLKGFCFNDLFFVLNFSSSEIYGFVF